MDDPTKINGPIAIKFVAKAKQAVAYQLNKNDDAESVATYAVLGLTRMLGAFTDYVNYKDPEYGEIVAKFQTAAQERGFSLDKLPDNSEIFTECACIAIYGTADFDAIRTIELKKATPQTRKKIETARAEGALTGIGERLLAPSDPEFEAALVTSAEGAGYFRRGPNGDVIATDVNPAIIRWLAKTVYINRVRGIYHETRIYIPSQLKELGIDARPRATKDEKKLSRIEARQQFVDENIISMLEDVWGRLPGDSEEYKVFTVFSRDPESEMLSFTSPFLQNLVIALLEKETAKREAGDFRYLNLNDLVLASAASEQNQAAVEMMIHLTNGVLRRGVDPDSKLEQNKKKKFKDEHTVTYRTSCSSLIEKCPLMLARLESLDTSSKRTQFIKRSFNAMYRMLRSKSALYDYYLDVTVTEILPTMSTLDNSMIVITHHGMNPEYRRPMLPQAK